MFELWTVHKKSCLQGSLRVDAPSPPTKEKRRVVGMKVDLGSFCYGVSSFRRTVMAFCHVVSSFRHVVSSFRHTDTPRSFRRIASSIRRLVSFVVSSFRCGIRRFVMSFRRFVVSTRPLREAIIRRTLHEGLSISHGFSCSTCEACARWRSCLAFWKTQ